MLMNFLLGHRSPSHVASFFCIYSKCIYANHIYTKHLCMEQKLYHWLLLIAGNTHVMCHMGMSSCKQRHHNMFAVTELITITNTIYETSPCLTFLHLIRPLLHFPHSLTPIPPPLAPLIHSNLAWQRRIIGGGSSASIGLCPMEQSTSSQLLLHAPSTTSQINKYSFTCDCVNIHKINIPDKCDK